jgi:hypothetical protein
LLVPLPLSEAENKGKTKEDTEEFCIRTVDEAYEAESYFSTLAQRDIVIGW